MNAIALLTDAQLLALSHFIHSYVKRYRSAKWRQRFVACARRGFFGAYVSPEENTHLLGLVERHGVLIVCLLKSSHVLERATRLAARGDTPVPASVVLPTSRAASP
jgi:hypothetical protein